jgi:putative ABC transport system substrate-binding protein
MQRRTFIGGSAAILAGPVSPRYALAEQPTKLPVVGYLNPTTPGIAVTTAILQGLGETGYVEGQGVAVEYRWAEGYYDRLPALAADLVGRKVNVIVATGGVSALAAKRATSTIPIVFEMGTDPVEVGLVASLNRPGGNLTGVSLLNVELAPKRLELLHELAPAPIIGLLINPNNRNADIISRDVAAAASTLGLTLHVLYASEESDFDTVLTDIAEQRAGSSSAPIPSSIPRASGWPGCFFATLSRPSTSIASLPQPAD